MSEQINKDLLAVCKELVRQAVANGGEVTVEAVENASAAIARAEEQPPNSIDADQQHRTHNGKRYRAVKSMGFCDECAFWNGNGRKCTLPMLDAALCVPATRADGRYINWQEM